MSIHWWNRFVLAAASLAALGAFAWTDRLTADPVSLAKSVIFTAFAIGFLGSVFGALFLHRS
jgi:hypothetical protein